MKKLLFTLTLVLAAMTAAAQNTTLQYAEQSDGTLWVVKSSGALYSGNIVIPSTSNGKQVTGIASGAFQNCADLTELTVPASVVTIGNEAFRASGLKKLTFQDGDADLTIAAYYGWDAFRDCTQLQTVYLGRQYVSDRPLFHNLTTITTATVGDKVKTLQKEVFSGCTGLNRLILGKNITTIEASAFSGCTSLPSVTLPTTVTSIGNSAFNNCTSLASINIPSGVTTIGSGAFMNCSSLAALTIPASVETIYNEALRGSGLKSFTIEDGDTDLTIEALYGWDVFRDCTQLQTVYLGRQYVSGLPLFHNLTTITTATVGDKVKSVQKNVFNGCTGLEHLILGKSVTTIEEGAFKGCTSLPSVTLPGKVTSIGSSAFNNCTSLASINIPSGVTTIEGAAFMYCSSLAALTIPASVETIRYEALRGTGLKSFTIEDGDTDLTIEAFYGFDVFRDCTNLETVYLGRQYVSDRPLFHNLTSIKTVTVGDKVQTVQKEVFRGCTGLSSVSLGKNIATIGNYAFQGCSSIESFVLPEYLTEIGNHAFESCSALVSINIPSQVTTIGGCAFMWCSSLEELTIPASVTTIGYEALRGTGLKKITFQDGITDLTIEAFYGFDVFRDCTNLETVYLGRKYVSDRPLFHNLTTIKQASIGSTITEMQSEVFSGCTGLTNIYSHNAVPPTCSSDKVFNGVNKQTCLLTVARGAVSAYKAAPVWKDFYNIEEMEETKCATPTATLENGRLHFACTTKNVTFHYTCAYPADMAGTGDDVAISQTIRLTLYASRTGLEDSDVATYDLLITGGSAGMKGDVNEDGSVDVADIATVITIMSAQ